MRTDQFQKTVDLLIFPILQNHATILSENKIPKLIHKVYINSMSVLNQG